MVQAICMEEPQVLVIGAGIAGLTGAVELARAGVGVKILEARDRLGGRLHTISSPPEGLPVELGAEFVHGAENLLWPLIRGAHLRTHQVPDRHWRASRDSLQEIRDFWERLSQVFERINPATPDQDCESFLDQAWSLSGSDRKIARDFIEGFHAAPAERLSAHALAQAEKAAEQEKGTLNFRLTEGYGALVGWLAAELASKGVEVLTNHVAKKVLWEPGHVEVMVQTPHGKEVFRGHSALVTVPLGVLQEPGPAALHFEPRLPAKERALRGLGVGKVLKLSLRFSDRFWPVDNFGFIHLDDPWLPTWWADERGLLLTGWAGGPRAEALSFKDPEEILSLAVRALAACFRVEPERVRALLIESYHFNWSADPFARGAYSYTPVGMMAMPARLAAPVGGTLFFAGEATNTQGDQGTAHGAAATGRRAAAEILSATGSSRSLGLELELKK